MKKIVLILMTLILISCGTKSKSKNSSESVEKVNSEILKKDSINKIESIISKRVEEKLTEYRNESSKNDSEKIKVVTTTETLDYSGGEPLVVETPEGIIRISGNGRITKHTKKEFQEIEKSLIEKQNLELTQKLQSKLDSINEVTIAKSEINKVAKEIVNKKKDTSSEKKSSGLGFWFWFWLILIILIILAFTVFRKWLLTQFPFLRLLIKS